VPKFRRATPLISEVISANLLHFKPIFDPLEKKSLKKRSPRSLNQTSPDLFRLTQKESR